MFAGMLTNVALGSGLKLLGGVVGKFMSSRHQHKMAILQAPTDRIVALQGGEDRATDWTKHTRRVLAFTLIGTFCYILIHITVFNPDWALRILIPADHSVFAEFFGTTTDEETITVSAGSLFWRFFSLIEIVTGFYFTKVGK